MKNRKILSLLAFLSISFAVFANNDKGIEFYKAGMYEAAKNFFLQQKSENPDEQAVAAYYLGLIYTKEQNANAAVAEFKRAINIAPKLPYGYIGQGRVELKNNVKEAEKLFKQAEGLGKKNADVQVQIADAYFANNMIAKATSTLEKAKKINKEFADIYLLEGDMIIKSNVNGENIGKAMNRYDDADYFSKNTSKLAFVKLAQMYRLQNRQDLALNKINAALALDNDYLPAYIVLGDIKNSQKRYKEAIEAYEKVIATCEPPIEVFETYAQALYLDNQFDKSLQKIQMVFTQKTNNATLRRLEAYNLYELGEYNDGVQKMEKFMVSVPQDKHIYLDFITLGRLYTKQNNYDKAIENFNKAIALDTENPDTYKEIALVYSSAGQYDEALSSFEKYFELNPNYLNIELYLYSEICINAADAICFEVSDALSKEIIEAKRALLEKYVEKGVWANTELIKRAPDSYLGYFGRANIYARVDTYMQRAGQNIEGMAKPFYDEAIEFMINNNADSKLNNYIVQSYQYLRSYYYIKKDTKSMIEVVKKILAIDPNNARAREDAKILKIKI